MFLDIDLLRVRLEELASLERQRRLWLGNSPGEMSDFTEAWCGAFDDSRLAMAMDEGLILQRYGSGITGQFEALRALLRKVPQNLSDEEQIEHPAMDDVRRVAGELLKSGVFPEESAS